MAKRKIAKGFDRNVFAARLKEARIDRRLSVAVAARAIAVEPSEWQKWEDIGKIPSARDFVAASVLLDVASYWLAGMLDDRSTLVLPKGRKDALAAVCG